MINTDFNPELIMQQVANLMQEVANLKQQLNNHEITIVRQEQTITEQQRKIDLLQSGQKLTPGVSGHAGSHNSITGVSKISKATNTLSSKLPNLLSLPVLILLVGAIIFTLVVSLKDAQSKILVNPLGYTQQFGSILLPSASVITGTLMDEGVRVGVVATGNPSLDLATLPIFDTGVYGAGSGYGVYGVSSSSQGYGVYAANTATTGLGSGYAIYGTSQKGIGVGGTSFGSGYGVYGVSNSGAAVYGSGGTGPGILASSINGAPLSILAGPTPTDGSRSIGDFYVDVTGKVYVWAKSDDGLTSNWRRLQFAT